MLKRFQRSLIDALPIGRVRIRPHEDCERPRPFVADLLDNTPLDVIDVGARGDLVPHWLVLDGYARVVAFEPDEEACCKLQAQYASRGHGEMYTALPIALAGSNGPRTLYVTNVPSGSSLMAPEAWLSDYAGPNYVHPIRELTIETRTLEDVIDTESLPSPDMLKVDVQRAELEVLRGAGHHLDHAIALEVEIGVARCARGQPPIHEMLAFLDQRGFELFDIRSLRAARSPASYHRDTFAVNQRSPTISARLWEVDAVAFRRVDETIERGEAAVRKLATALCTYNFFAEAHHLVSTAEKNGVLPASDADSARNAVVDWHRVLRRQARFGTSPGWTAVRRLMHRLGLDDQARWEQYTSSLYPNS